MWKLKDTDLTKHYKEFSTQWENYTKTLALSPSEVPGHEDTTSESSSSPIDEVSNHLSGARLDSELNEEQKEQLKKLKTEIDELAR